MRTVHPLQITSSQMASPPSPHSQPRNLSVQDPDPAAQQPPLNVFPLSSDPASPRLITLRLRHRPRTYPPRPSSPAPSLARLFSPFSPPLPSQPLQQQSPMARSRPGACLRPRWSCPPSGRLPSRSYLKSVHSSSLQSEFCDDRSSDLPVNRHQAQIRGCRLGRSSQQNTSDRARPCFAGSLSRHAHDHRHMSACSRRPEIVRK